jgi:hypothetical protein
MRMFDDRHLAISGLAVCFTIGVGVMTMAQRSGSGQVNVSQLSQREIIEKLDGKDAKATPSTTSRSRPSRLERHSTNRRGLCTGWPKTRAARPRPASWR